MAVGWGRLLTIPALLLLASLPATSPTTIFNQWQVVATQPASIFQGGFAASVSLGGNVSALGSPDVPDRLVLVFGGVTTFSELKFNRSVFGPGATFSSQLWIFHTRFLTWSSAVALPGVTLNLPSPRAGHSMDVVSPVLNSNASLTMIFLFGGLNGSSVFDDTWIFYFFDLHVIATTNLPISGPSPRWGHRTAVLNSSLYLYGGFSSIYEDTPAPDTHLWRLDVPSQDETTIQWTRYTAMGSPPTARGLFYMFLNGPDTLLVVFGWENPGAFRPPLNSTLSFTINHQTQTYNWSSLPITLGPGVVPLAAGASCLISDAEDRRIPLIMWGSQYDARAALVYGQYTVPSSTSYYLFNNTWLAVSSQKIALDSLMGLIGVVFAKSDDTLLMLGGFNSYEVVISTRSYFSGIMISTRNQFSLNLQWLSFSPVTLPDRRIYPTALFVNSNLYLMGGWRTQYTTETHLWSFNITDSTWAWHSRALPSAAAMSASLIISNSNSNPLTTNPIPPFLVYGGISQYPNGTDYLPNKFYQINSFDTENFGVYAPLNVPSLPRPQAHQGSATFDSTLYIFGGTTCEPSYNDCDSIYQQYTWKSYSSDLWAFSQISNSWTFLGNGSNHPPSEWPRGRSHMAFGALFLPPSEAFLVLFSGRCDSGLLSDLWVYSLSSHKWTELPLGPTPMPRHSPGVGLFGTPPQKFLVFGGQGTTDKPITFKAMHLLSLTRTNPDPTNPLFQGLPVGGPYPVWDNINVSITAECKANYSAVAVNQQAVYSYGGTANESIILDTLCTIPLGCPAGSYSSDFATRPCTLCAVGSYTPQAASTSCILCPPLTTTAGPGSENSSQCSLCAAPSPCRGFPCTTVNGQIHCECAHLFRGQFCEDSMLLQIAIALPIVTTMSLVILTILFRYRRANRQLTNDRDLKEHLLEKMSIRMHEFVDVFTIKQEDLNVQAEPLGHGAFCEVFLGTFEDVPVAVKLLHASIAVDSNVRKAFQRELKQLRALRHPHILAFLGAGEWSDRRLFLVTEYCARGSLNDFLSESTDPLSPALVLRLATEICEGMLFLHARGRIHRDLKSPNILLTESLAIKIADLGAAKVLALRDRNSSVGRSTGSISGNMVGTVSWLPPEAQTSGSQMGLEGDVYSFGVVLWELCTRKIPFADEEYGPNGRFLRKRIQEGLRPSLDEIPASLAHPTLTALLTSCWERDKAARPSFAQIADRLREITFVTTTV